MKLSINCAHLRKLVAAVLPAVAVGDSITSGVRLEADDCGRLLATATNYETTVKAWAEADIASEGAVVAPGLMLAKALGTLPDDALVRLTSDDEGNHLTVEAARARFEINCKPLREWPEIDAPQGGRRIDFEAAQLLTGLQFVVPFVCNSDLRPSICHVHVKIAGGDLQLTSTDGLRLARYTVGHTDREANLLALVGRLAVAQVLAALKREGNDCAPFLEVSGKSLLFHVGKTSIQSRMADHAFPDANRVIHAENRSAQFEFVRNDLIASVNRAAIMGAKDGDQVVHMALRDATLHISASSAIGRGAAADDLDLFSGSGGKLEITVNPAFLVGALRSFPAEHVTLQAIDNFSPIQITTDECPGCVHVAMPVRV